MRTRGAIIIDGTLYTIGAILTALVPFLAVEQIFTIRLIALMICSSTLAGVIALKAFRSQNAKPPMGTSEDPLLVKAAETLPVKEISQ